ncbi:MAG TPA: hypothetical protein VIG76_10070 [Amnibacterium sp.]|uniref:hypothetical protein n=1 Tax=Amnibacterium sp. TaxID=1872496 RepID=UPI002F952A53
MTLKRRSVLITAGATAAVLAAGGTTAAFAAGSTPTTASSTASASGAAAPAACAPGVGALLHAIPRSLRTDLQHLAKDSASAKAADRATIKAKALEGGYGIRVERVARIVAGDDGKLTAALPASLKADLKTLRADPKGSDARKQEAAAIWSKALSGGYGSSIESLAKDAKTRVDQRCAARTTGGTGTGTGTGS